MLTEKEVTYRSFLEREFRVRVEKNSGYSLRAFARDIGIPASNLSQILKGTCGLSRESGFRVANRLRLTEKESEFFVTLIDSEHSRSKTGKLQAQKKLEGLKQASFNEFDLDRFKIIADWYHFSILELTTVKDFQSNPEWIAKRLGISVKETQDAIDRLMSYGLLVEDENKNLRETEAQLATPSGIPSRELKNHHSQLLRKADRALEEVPLTERDISEITMAIDSSQMEEARRALVEFRRKFCKDFQQKSTRDRVYCLAIQFFPTDYVSTQEVAV